MLNIRFRERTNTWPGFVDLFSNLVIILIFVLIVFVFLWTTTSVFNKHTGVKAVAALKETNAEQAQQIEKMKNSEYETKRMLVQAQSALENMETNNSELMRELDEMDLSVEDLIGAYEAKVKELTGQLNQAKIDKERATQLEQERRDLQVQMQEMLDQRAVQLDIAQQQLQYAQQENATQLAQWSQDVERLQAALDAAEEKNRNQEAEYVEMSTRLNKALADKVAELKNVQAYQSDFYKSIKTALGDRAMVQPDGDRFIVSSDILFPSGSYALSAAGKQQLRLIANVIKDLEHKIPSDVNWIIRVDGHTDKKPVLPGTRGYSNNTELSLRRATAVADALAAAGVSRRRLVPSGFGDLHPVELGNDAAALQKNRRIELQLTNR